MTIRISSALFVALLLAACGDKAEDQPGDDRRSAEGEVLGGTISDAMLPLDTAKSQSPPLRAKPSPAASENAAPMPGEDASEQDGPSPDRPVDSRLDQERQDPGSGPG